MESSINQKIEKVLNKLMETNFKLKNDAYINLLLTHLTSAATDDGQVACYKQLVLNWTTEIITKWKSTKETPNTQILAFILNLLKSFCVDEESFMELKNADVFDYLMNLSSNAIKTHPQPKIELAFMKLLYSLLGHKVGQEWIISTKHWDVVLNSTLTPNTIYISREGCSCMAKLLVTFAPVDNTLLKNIIELILEPLNKTSNNVADYIDGDFCKTVSPSLQLLNEILLCSLENQISSSEKECILIVMEEYDLKRCIQTLISLTKNEDLLHDLYRILVGLSFFEMYLKSNQKNNVHYTQEDTLLKTFDILSDVVSKGCVESVLKLTLTILKYWKILKYNFSTWCPSKCNKISFEDQLLTLQLLPVSTFGTALLQTCILNLDEDNRSEFIKKVMNLIIPSTQRIMYKWRPHLIGNSSLSYGIISFKYFLHSRSYYSRENAILAFQFLIYNLIDIIRYLKSRSDLINHYLEEPEYLTVFFETITILIEEYNITWKDSTETVNILNCVHDFLNFLWPSTIVVKALKLLDMSISKYISPQMIFLIDDINYSIVVPLAPILHANLHNGEWEVRDSTLELICTLSRNANTKYTSIGKPILENNFPDIILNMAIVDGSFFVRSTALKCLQQMIQVSQFWNSLSKENILDKTLKILHVDTEGIVRMEAATLIDTIYRYQDIPENTLSNIYDTMNHAVVVDLHWEVRVKALQFWKSVIDHHLSEKGMMDGIFPPCIFSKELRKIVNLTEVEIKKRLMEVLHQLSLDGCLAVFHTALQDQCDLEVNKHAVEMISDFVQLLKKYKITSSDLAPTEASSVNAVTGTSIECVSYSSPLSEEGPCFAGTTDFSIDDVQMDDILDSRDLNLLESVYCLLDQPSTDCIQIKSRTILPPREFVDLIYSGIECHMKEREKWVEKMDNFNSLLDDILREYEITDVNSMDCY